MRPLSLLAALALALGACAGPGDDATESPAPSPGETATTATPSPDSLALTRTCTFTSDGLEVDVPYPEDWHPNSTEPTEDGSAMPPCRVFHHEPFELPRVNELTGYDFFVKLEHVPFARVAGSDDDPMSELLSRRETQVDGRAAVARERRATEDGLTGPAGARHFTYAVDMGGERTLILSTYEVADLDYERNRDVLDAVAQDLRIRDSGTETACSAHGAEVAAAPAAQPGLPAAVADTRAEVFQAATTCDFERLDELAGEGFTYSFGEQDDPIAHWRRQESDGREPMRFLAGMLNRPYATVAVQGETQYVWPSAFSYDNWEDVPEADREALKPLYDEDDFAEFARFGGYMGYRVGIGADGQWLFFVAGD